MSRCLLVASLAACAPAPATRTPTPIVIRAEPDAAEQAGGRSVPTAESESRLLFLDIVQEGTRTRVRDGSSVQIERVPFAFRFPVRLYTNDARHVVQLAASADRSMFSSIEPGPLEAATADGPFGPGTGLAAYADGYHELFLDSQGHHYLFHGSDGESRVRPVERLSAGRWLVEFAVPRIRWQGISYNPAQLPLRHVHCVVFSNENLDDAVSSDELIRFTLNLGDAH